MSEFLPVFDMKHNYCLPAVVKREKENEKPSLAKKEGRERERER